MEHASTPRLARWSLLLLTGWLTLQSFRAAAQPTWSWARQGNASATSRTADVATDPSNNTYVGGYFAGTLPLSGGSLTSTGASDFDGFLIRLNAAGNVSWAVSVSGSGGAGISRVTVDGSGNVWVAGLVSGQNTFGSTSGTGQTVSAQGAVDIFVANYSASGVLQWVSTSGGGNTSLEVQGLAVSSANEAYVLCNFTGTLALSSGPLTSAGAGDLLLARVAGTGSFAAFTRLGGQANEAANDMIRLSNGDLAVCGYLTGRNGDIGGTTIGNNFPTTAEALLFQLNPTTGRVAYATTYGNAGSDSFSDLAPGPSGTYYVTGQFDSPSILFNTRLTRTGATDSFVAAIDDATGAARWVTHLRGANAGVSVQNYELTTDASGRVIAAGKFDGAAAFGSQAATASSEAVYVAQLDATGAAQWVQQADGWFMKVQGLAADASGAVVLGGYFQRTLNFGTTAVTAPTSNDDAFVARLTGNPPPPTYCVPGNFSGCGAAPITRVQLTGTTLDNASACQNNTFGNAFAEYPASGTATATLQQGVTYQFGVTSSSSAATLAAWADWNQNGTFESSEFTSITTGASANTPMLSWLTVPANAVLGQTKIRVRSRASNSTINSTDACASFASGETEDYIVTIAAGPAPTSPYCTPGNFTSNCNSAVISRVRITGTTLDNASTCQVNANGNAYAVFAPTGAATGTVQQGVSYQFGITTPNSSSTLTAWVDWNQNGTFESSEFINVTTGASANTPMLAALTVPANAALGQTRLRVRSRASNSTINSTDACAFFGSGETEDYTITVAAGPSPAPIYCTPGNFISNCNSAVISRVTITGSGLDNASSCQVNSVGNAYTVFQPTGAATGTVQQGVSYQFGITTANSSSTLTAWVDWNQNGTFESSEFIDVTTGASANTPMLAALTVPANAALGQTRLRVRSRASNSTINSTDACAFFGSGETEDYTITVAAGPSPAPTYCTPGNFISNCNSAVISRVTITGSGLSNPSACQVDNFGNAYAIFPPTGAATGTVQRSVSYQMAVTSSFNNTTLAAWIDWDQNGVFDNSEFIAISGGTSAGVTANVGFTVPANATLGQTRLRVRSRASNSTISAGDPCAFFGSGETEDYTITVGPAPNPLPTYCTPGNFSSNCNGAIITQVQLTGSGLSNTSTCQVDVNGNAYVSYPGSGTTLGVVQPGTTYALRVTTASSATVVGWADWNRNNLFDFNEGVTVFQSTTTGSVGLSVPTTAVNGLTTLRVRSRNGSISAADACGFFSSGETEDYVLQVGGTVQPSYCTPGNFGGCNNGIITRVVLANTPLNNSSACQTNAQGNAYIEYPASGSTTGTVAQGTTYGLTVTPSAAFGALGVWVDWNQNTTFEASEYQTIRSSTLANVPATVGLVVPSNATLGSTRMRIRFRTDAGLDPTTGACATYNTGETEDYTITVVSGPNPVPQYCVPGNFSGGCANGTITRVTLTGTTLDNPSACATNAFGNAYAQYPAAGTTTGTVAQGTTYGLTVTPDASFGALGVWVDWNRNNTFEASEYQAVRSSTIANTPYSIGLIVPANASLGQTMMRIRFRTDAGLDPTTGACATYNTGETEDYTITVVSGPNPVPQYCVPGNFSGGCANGTITRVSLTGTTLDNPSACATNAFGNAYAQYPAAGTTTGTVQPGTTYALAVTPNQDFGALGVWVDWNRNNTFEATEYTSLSTSTRANQAVSVALNVPANASLGATMLRVRFRTDAGLDPTTGACATYNTGETEDYPLTVNNCALTVPTISAGNTGTCAGSTLTLSASGVPAGAAYLWSGPNGFSSTQPSPQLPNVQPANSGAYTLTITLNNCSATSAALNLTVNPLPNVTVQPSRSTALCQGETVTLTATGATSYLWSTGATTASITVSTAGTYTVTGTGAGNCPATSAPVTVTVSPLPTATITASGPTTFCQGGSVTLTATGGTSYQWSTGATSPSITVTTTGQYTVTATSANCSATSAPVTVTVTPQPSAAFSYGSASYCRSGVNPTPSITGTSGGTFSATPAGLNLNATTGQINLTNSAAGTYTVTYALTGTCPAQQSQTVTITTAPVATFSYPAGTPCAGSAGTLAPVLGAGATAGTFGATPAGLSLNPQTGIIDVTTSAAGTYTVTNTIAASGGCAAAAATATVTISALPTATITAGGPTTFCQGGSVTLTAATGGAGATYEWLLGGQPISGATQRSYIANQSGAYTVTVTSAAGCAATSAPTTVTVTPLPSAAFSYPTSTFCLGGANPTPTITGLAGGRFAATPSGQLVINMFTGVINLTASPAGTYTITYTVNDGQCAGSASQTVTLTAAPLASFSYAGGPQCAGSTGTLAPTFGTGASGGTFSATPAGLSLNATTGVVDLATSAAGNYTVTNTIAASGSCPATTATATLTLQAAPSAAFSYPAPTFCLGGANPAPTISGTSGGTFSASPAGLILNATTGQLNLSTSAAGTYTVTYAVGGPCPAQQSQTITLTPAPSAAFSYPYPGGVCAGAPSPAIVTLAAGATAGTFSAVPAGLVFLDPATGWVDLGQTAPGTYTITNTVAAGGGCPASTATATLLVLPAGPTPTITSQPQPNGAVLLTASAGTSYQWFLNGGPIPGATSQTYLVTTATQNGTYTVQVFGANACPGLSAPTTVTVTAAPAELTAASVQLFPNPTTGLTTLALPAQPQPLALELLDATGRVVLRRTVPAGTTEYGFDAQPLPTGVYVLRARTDRQVITRRLTRE